MRRKGVNRHTVVELLKHRVGLGIVEFPEVAQYLSQHYERLEGRVFEKKRFTHMGKRWYEYHRPRDPALMLTTTRIVSPTLVREVRFALDQVGYLSDHACLFIQPTSGTRRRWSAFEKELAKVLGRSPSRVDSLKYCLAFLNSEYAQERLVTGRRPTPKGSYPVTSSFLREIPIPPPNRRSAADIIDLVTKLVETRLEEERSALEALLSETVKRELRS